MSSFPTNRARRRSPHVALGATSERAAHLWSLIRDGAPAVVQYDDLPTSPGGDARLVSANMRRLLAPGAARHSPADTLRTILDRCTGQPTTERDFGSGDVRLVYVEPSWIVPRGDGGEAEATIWIREVPRDRLAQLGVPVGFPAGDETERAWARGIAFAPGSARWTGGCGFGSSS